MKQPFITLTSLVLILGLVGLGTWRGEVIALAIPLAVYALYAVMHWPEEIQVSVEHSVDEPRVQADTLVNIHVHISMEGPLVDEVFIEDVIPAGLVWDKGNLEVICSSRIRKNLEWEYCLRVNRGDYRAIETRFRTGDTLGCFEVQQIQQTALGVTGHPICFSPGSLKIRPPQTRGFSGPIPARQAGAGVDFFGLREYQAGDSPRQVNWRVAARGSHDLYTNIFEQERVADVGIILDSRQAVNLNGPNGSLFEHAVSAAAGLADSFLSDGNRVGMVVYGSGMESVFPGYGKRQRSRILSVLVRVKPGINYALNSLSYLPTRMFPARSQIVLISPLIPEDAGVIIRMRARGYAVLVVSPDPVTFEAGNAANPPEMAHRLARAERQFLLQQMRRAGIQVVDWQVGSSLEASLREELAHREISGNRRGMFI